MQFWLAVLVTGIAAGLGAGLLMLLLNAVQSIAWGKGTGDFLDAIQRDGPIRRVGILVLAGAIVAASRSLLRLGKSGHSGDLTAAIWFADGRMPILRTVTTAITSIIVVGLGASLGREAAPKQLGAVLAGIFGGWAKLPPTQLRLLVACGAGGGMAAVYNVPFGGALFALEVLLGTVSLALVPPALLATATATATAWLILPNRATYQIPFYNASPTLIAWSLVAGPLIGLAAVAYVRLICWADDKKPKASAAILAPLIVFALLGAVAMPLPQLLGNGKDIVQAAFADNGLPIGLLLALAIAKPVATAACLGAGAPGGLFTPSLAVGAVIGLLGGKLTELLVPGLLPLGPTAIVAAAAFLAATTQGPLSAIILVAELTRRLDGLLVAVLFAVCGAVLVARSLDRRSIYSGRIHLGRTVAGSAPGETISTAARYPEVLERLLRTEADIRVVDEHGTAVGCVTRASTERSVAGPLEIATARDLLTPR